jgi:hypothetical protein
MMEAVRSSGTSVLTGATRRHILEDDIFQSHRHEHQILRNVEVIICWNVTHCGAEVRAVTFQKPCCEHCNYVTVHSYPIALSAQECQIVVQLEYTCFYGHDSRCQVAVAHSL